MIWLILWLLTALTGATEDVPVPTIGEVVTETCNREIETCDSDRDGSTPPPPELPGPSS